MLLDGDLFVDELAVLIREHVAAATKPLRDEIAELKASLAALPVPKDGKDADPELVRAEVARAVAEIPKPQDGKSVDLGVLFTEIGAAATRAVEALPKMRDGKDADPEEIRAEIARQVAILPRPRDGRDFDTAVLDIALARATEETHGFITEQIDKRIAALPKAIDHIELDDIISSAVQKSAVAIIKDCEKRFDDLPKPKDGKDGADADPAVVEQMVADAVARLPRPADGKDVDPQAVAAMIRSEAERVIAEMPAPANGTDGEPGRDGKDGTDGVQLDDIDMELRGDRTLVFSLMSGGQIVEKEVRLPWPLDRGTFRSGKTYEQGDCVTYAGNLWIATGDTSEAPGVGPAALWRMAVKRGKDGRSADAS